MSLSFSHGRLNCSGPDFCNRSEKRKTRGEKKFAERTRAQYLSAGGRIRLKEAEGERYITGMAIPGTSDPGTWVDRHGDVLVRYAMLRLGDPHLSEDLVQETFLSAWKARDTFKGDSSERTWLVGILKHKIADHYRKKGRGIPMEEGESSQTGGESTFFNQDGMWKDGPEEWGGDPADLFRKKEFLAQVTKCVSDLTPRLAHAFTLRDIDGLESKEICKVLGVSETNLWVILHRARMLMRRCLEIHWFGGDAGKR
jgi:RNA polymerase sigma-70 factor (TIGR02943 family)